MTSSEQDSARPGGLPPRPVPMPPARPMPGGLASVSPASVNAVRPTGDGGADAPGSTGPFGASSPKPSPPVAASPAPASAYDEAAVAEVVARLDALEDLPVTEHVAVFEAVHRTLQDTLAAVDGS